MSLTDPERRRLRDIEQTMITEDPILAAMLVKPHRFALDSVPARLAVAFVATAALLVWGAQIWNEPALTTGGLLVLMSLPVTWLVAIARRKPLLEAPDGRPRR